ncbi:MAG: hypothetical protein DRJ56_06450 [Thermoprotei archaeon]|nr:MAG: hypothetical protein DRJ56_06450 [Thermoprotei archaeon]
MSARLRVWDCHECVLRLVEVVEEARRASAHAWDGRWDRAEEAVREARRHAEELLEGGCVSEATYEELREALEGMERGVEERGAVYVGEHMTGVVGAYTDAAFDVAELCVEGRRHGRERASRP